MTCLFASFRALQLWYIDCLPSTVTDFQRTLFHEVQYKELQFCIICTNSCQNMYVKQFKPFKTCLFDLSTQAQNCSDLFTEHAKTKTGASSRWLAQLWTDRSIWKSVVSEDAICVSKLSPGWHFEPGWKKGKWFSWANLEMRKRT